MLLGFGAGLGPVPGEGGQGQADDDRARDGDQAAAERADDWRGQRAQGSRLQVAELAAAHSHDVVGRGDPAAEFVGRDLLDDRAAEDHGEGIRRARDRQHDEGQPQGGSDREAGERGTPDGDRAEHRPALPRDAHDRSG
jgi:hypothetical protein